MKRTKVPWAAREPCDSLPQGDAGRRTGSCLTLLAALPSPSRRFRQDLSRSAPKPGAGPPRRNVVVMTTLSRVRIATALVAGVVVTACAPIPDREAEASSTSQPSAAPTQVLPELPMSEDDQRRLAASLAPGLADGSEIALISSQIDDLVDQDECEQARELGLALADLWSTALGASWVSHPQFDELALQPVQRLAANCGTEHAYEVVQATEAMGLTWRALTETIADQSS